MRKRVITDGIDVFFIYIKPDQAAINRDGGISNQRLSNIRR